MKQKKNSIPKSLNIITMFGVNVEKEIQSVKTKETSQFKMNPLEEVKLLMAGDAAEDIAILSKLSKHSDFQRIQRHVGEQIELEAFDEKFKGRVYTSEQIKKLCMDYNLRFLNSQRYTGSLDVEITAKLKEFAKECDLDLMQALQHDKFYIMAPADCFILDKKEFTSKAAIRRAEQDPVIFYRINNAKGEDVYRMIHKWGNDFSIFRLIQGFKWKNIFNYHIYHTLTAMIPVSFLYSFLAPMSMLYVGFWPLAIIFALSNFVAFLSFTIKKQDEGEEISDFFSHANWNSNAKLEK